MLYAVPDCVKPKAQPVFEIFGILIDIPPSFQGNKLAVYRTACHSSACFNLADAYLAATLIHEFDDVNGVIDRLDYIEFLHFPSTQRFPHLSR